MAVDVSVMDQGTIVLFVLRTDAARAWVDEHVQAEPYMFVGSGLVVEHRFAAAIADGMSADGLSVE
jgi:hypothetical protein